MTEWENGEIKKIDGENLLKVCDVLDITPYWLLCGGELPAPERPAPKIEAIEVEQPTYAWISKDEAALITLYRTTDDRSRRDILAKLKGYPRVMKAAGGK